MCRTLLPLDAFSPSYRGTTGTWCRQCFAAYHRGESETRRKRHEPRVCAWCGEQYEPKQLKSAAKYCSRKCKTDARNANAKAQRVDAKQPRMCAYCAAQIEPERRSDASFCSPECNEKAHQLKRKLRARGGAGDAAGYVRAYICERDGWKCGICGDPVNPHLRHPDPGFGSLDHVIPVAHGGTSDPANLRLAHLRCNVQRRDAGGPVQLALVG